MSEKEFTKDWIEEAVAMAMSLGYSRFGIHMLQPSSDGWTLALLMQARAVQKPKVLDPFMIMRQNEYIHAKGDNIIGQIVTPAIEAKREQIHTLERERLSAAVQTKVSLSSSLPPQNSYDTDQTLTGAQCTAPEINDTAARMQLNTKCGLSTANQAQIPDPASKRGKSEPPKGLSYGPMINAGLTPHWELS